MPGRPAKAGVILVCCAALTAAPRRIVEFSVPEDSGIARRDALVMYHAALDAQVSRLADHPAMWKPLLEIIRSPTIRQDAPGAIPMDAGSLWSQYSTQIINSYDAKSMVAYTPVLSARLAATGRH